MSTIKLTAEFVEERINTWELKHGSLTSEGKDCLKGLLWACLRLTPSDILVVSRLKQIEKSLKDEKPICLCEKKRAKGAQDV